MKGGFALARRYAPPFMLSWSSAASRELRRATSDTASAEERRPTARAATARASLSTWPTPSLARDWSSMSLPLAWPIAEPDSRRPCEASLRAAIDSRICLPPEESSSVAVARDAPPHPRRDEDEDIDKHGEHDRGEGIDGEGAELHGRRESHDEVGYRDKQVEGRHDRGDPVLDEEEAREAEGGGDVDDYLINARGSGEEMVEAEVEHAEPKDHRGEARGGPIMALP
jgi:hypothetical protein